MKLYIAVLDQVPSNMVPVLVAHSVLAAHLKWWPAAELSKNDYWIWLTESFKKCVVKVNDKEFNRILYETTCVSGYEKTVLNGEPSCLVVFPQKEYPNVLKFAKLWID